MTPVIPRTTDYVMARTRYRPNGCLEWTAGTGGRTGYGHFKALGKTVLVHRWAYERFVGPIPDGMFVCHHCDNRLCLQPGHLFLGTAKDNTDDARKKGRLATGDRSPRRKRPESFPPVVPAPMRFATKYSVDELSGCWNWLAATSRDGYARFNPTADGQVQCHRWSYEHHVGPIPPGLCVSQSCNNRRCVNPAHLELLTKNDIVLRNASARVAQRAVAH